MATTALSIEDYLRLVPDPDVEYVDGKLKERSMVMSVHGLLQAAICAWFISHRKEWKVLPAVEVRTRVSLTHVYLPDVVVNPPGKWPPILIEPPMIVIEILSPSDSFMELEEKCAGYSSMGIQNIWMVNPQRRTGRVWRQSAWIETTRFQVEGSAIYLDLEWLFSEMDSYDAVQ